MPRHEVDDLTIWFGTADAPCPVGKEPEAAPRIVVGVSPPVDDMTVIARLRCAGGPWQRLLLQPAERSPEAQYFSGTMPTQLAGTQVEYEIHARRGGARPRPERQVGPLMTYSVVARAVGPAPDEPERERSTPPGTPTLATGEVGPDATIDGRRAVERFALRFAAIAGAIPATQAKDGRVVWVRGDDALLVRTRDVRLVPRDGLVLVAIPVYTDQTGEIEVVVTFATGRPRAGLGLIMATEPVPRGDPRVVERWGDELTAAAWETLLSVVTAVAAEAGVDEDHQPLIPAALVAGDAGLVVTPQARHEFDRRLAGGSP